VVKEENLMRILLIEPDYKNKYPPLGLMKISTFHTNRGDDVIFYKGLSKELRDLRWDRIYISSLFTFYWAKTIKTINYYLKSVRHTENIFIGGVMATLMKEQILEELKVTVVEGLLNKKGKLGFDDDDIIDSLLPDYSIINPNENPFLNYSYPTSECYLTYATRGCVWKCPFCAVPLIEPIFSNSLSIANQVNAIRERYGEKKDLILMDNNVLASDCFPKIIEEIKSLGFIKGATFKYLQKGKIVKKNRYVDFNQGIDAHLLTEEKINLISDIAINPLRIAFDNIKDKEIYIEKVRLAAKYRIKILSNYILFNYKDTPEDFYERLRINIELNEEFLRNGYETRIWSFPMRFTPIKGEDAKSRKFIGKNWNKKYLRGIQCILLTTHGVVGPKKTFFEKAFGKNIEEFKRIIMLPEDFIISRAKFNLSTEMVSLNTMINSLQEGELSELTSIIHLNDFKDIKSKTDNTHIKSILQLYSIRKDLWVKK
jgi:hypothetical protein